MPGMYLKLFASVIAVSFLLAILLFVINARRRKPAEPEEVPYRKLGRNMIILSIIVVIILTPLSIDMADRRNPSPDEVTYNGVTASEGFRVAMDYNCMGCHTIVGNGAYYAPDLTYIARKAVTPENIRGLLVAFTGTKYMPFNLTDREIDALTAWMLYLRDLNTNRWPPMKPVVVSAAKPVEVESEVLKRGQSVYERYCSSCHGVDGRGVVPGAPDFTSREWWSAKIETEGIEAIVNAILKGKGVMPGYENVLSEEDVNAVVSYIQSFAEEKAQQEAEEVVVYGGFSFEPSFDENLGRWYESFDAWIVYWLITVIFSTFLIYSVLYWYARG